MVLSSTVADILDFLKDNQARFEGEKNNYIRNIAQETDYTQRTVREAIDFLESQGFVERQRKGQKKIVVLSGVESPDAVKTETA